MRCTGVWLSQTSKHKHLVPRLESDYAPIHAPASGRSTSFKQFPQTFCFPLCGPSPQPFPNNFHGAKLSFSLRWLIFYKNQVVTLGQITISMPHFQNFLDTGFNPATQNPSPETKPAKSPASPNNCKIYQWCSILEKTTKFSETLD